MGYLEIGTDSTKVLFLGNIHIGSILRRDYGGGGDFF